MSVEANKAVVARFYEELWNGRRLEVADEIFAPDCVTHQLRSGAEDVGVPRAADEIKRHVAARLASFPDLRFEVEQVVAEGDLVVTRSLMRGTHAGEWNNVAPTGRQAAIRMTVVHRLREGRIVEDWVLVESLGFYQQLGLLPDSKEIFARAATGDGADSKRQ
jgi:predicted ester cyclase